MARTSCACVPRASRSPRGAGPWRIGEELGRDGPATGGQAQRVHVGDARATSTAVQQTVTSILRLEDVFLLTGKSRFKELVKETAEALNKARDGAIIADSEWIVRDATARFRQTMERTTAYLQALGIGLPSSRNPVR